MAWLALALLPLLLSGAQPHERVVDEVLDAAGYAVPGGGPHGAPIPTDVLAPLPASAAVFGLLIASLLALGTKHVQPDNVLEHDVRRRMYEFLWQSGSAHLRRISTALGLSTTNATWHLDKLVKCGLVGEVKVNGFRMYYPKGAGRIVRDQCVVSAQVQSDNAKAVLEYVSLHPGAHQREIARALDVNHGTARWHLSRLADAGILVCTRKGRVTIYHVAEPARATLDAPHLRVGPSAA